MKRFIATILIYICFIALFLFAVFLVDLLPRIRWNVWEMPKGKLPIAMSVYESDKRQIERCCLNNMEYTRTHWDTLFSGNNGDSMRFFRKYVARRSLKEDKNIASPLETRKTCEVTVDTIVYDKTGLKCIAFIVVKEIPYRLPGLSDNCERYREFSSFAMAGVREKIDDRMQMFPLEHMSAFGFESHRSVANAVEEYYYTQLIGESVFRLLSEQDIKMQENVDDPAFFEKAPIFQKFDRERFGNNYSIHFEDTLYNCQVYFSGGAFYKYNYPY